MKDAVDLLNEQIADLKERNKELIETIEKLQRLYLDGETAFELAKYIQRVLEKHRGDRCLVRETMMKFEYETMLNEHKE